MSEEEFYLRRDLFLNELDKQNIDYIYEDYIQKEKEYKKEIERLNELVKGLREERDYLFNKTTTESNYEIERLNNIINELAFIFDDYNEFNEILEKYNYKLKGSDKE